MWHSGLLGTNNANKGEEYLHVRSVRDQNSSDFPENEQEIFNDEYGNMGGSGGACMRKKSKVGGKAAQALKELRERVENVIPDEKLTYGQMAFECGWLDKNGKGSASTYQYNERDFEGEYFSKSKVDRLKVPLVRRGMPEDEIYSVLTGISISSPGKKSRVKSLPETGGRSIPVLSRQTVLRLVRGEIRLGQISRISPEARKFEAAGVIMGWADIPETNDDTVVMEWDNGRGSWLIIDRSCKEFQEGESYVCLIGDVLRYGTVLNGKLYSDEGDDFGQVIGFGDHIPVVFGMVLWLMERKASRRSGD